MIRVGNIIVRREVQSLVTGTWSEILKISNGRESQQRIHTVWVKTHSKYYLVPVLELHKEEAWLSVRIC